MTSPSFARGGTAFGGDGSSVVTQTEEAIAELGVLPGAFRSLRQLARDYPDEFFQVATKHLESESESPAYRPLAELLLRQDSLLERLMDPRFRTCHKAVLLFRRLLSVDPTLDFRLARMLPGRNDTDLDRSLRGGHAARALDVLDQTSPGQRLLSVIGHLANCTDARISAKAALFLGRRVKNPRWLMRQLERDDNRLRANALESVWGAKSEQAIRVLEECADDPSNRVAGNALIGLHMAGDPYARVKAMVMAASRDPARRAAAAWVMGKIGDAEFVDCLKALIRDSSPQVRGVAVRSLAEIGRAESRRLLALAAEEKAAEEKAAEEALLQPAQETVENENGADGYGSEPKTSPEELNIGVPSFELRLDGRFIVSPNK